ncbi:MAG TPA: M23 family metallopeptidase [Mycobacteriales bacterium]
MARDVRSTPPWWFRAGARVRAFASDLGLLGILVAVVGASGWLPPVAIDVLGLGGFALIVVGIGSTFFPGAPALPPRRVRSPVRGRWSAANSPATRLPSHGTHGSGQTYAVDLVYEPEDGARPKFGHGPGFRPPEDFPAFGQEVRAPADGRVVAFRDSARDHRSRSNIPAMAYMMATGMVREFAGSRFLLGNHVVLDLGDGTFAALAHLRHRSVTVRPGQSVRRGDVVGHCGNTGNSSEPHLHFQLMDRPWALIAAGLPFVFTDVRIEGSGDSVGIPRDGEIMVAPDEDRSRP